MERYPLTKISRLLALKSVVKPDEAFFIRKIYRWYSSTYVTPLHTVQDLPIEDILEAYFENKYEEMMQEPNWDDLLKKEIDELLETDNQRFRREMQQYSKEVSDEEFLQKIMKEESEKKKAEEIKKRQQLAHKIEDVNKKPIEINVKKPKLIKQSKEAELPKSNLTKPDINMEFLDLDEDIGEWSIFDDPKQKKK